LNFLQKRILVSCCNSSSVASSRAVRSSSKATPPRREVFIQPIKKLVGFYCTALLPIGFERRLPL
jgi:hypothetical protein